MKLARLLSPLAAAVLVAGTATAALAQPVGNLNIAGALRIGTTPGGLFIDILPMGGGTGQVFADPFSQTGSFTLVAGTNGVMRDFNPAVGANSVPNLLVIGPFTFDLSTVFPGISGGAGCAGPAATGQLCTPPGTAFNLRNLSPTSSIASFSVAGMVMGPGGMSNFSGIFTAQFADLNLQQVIAGASTPEGIETSFSASFTANVVPEPSTYALMATGLVVLGGVAARRRRV